MKSWKRYRGSVLQGYLKKEFSRSLQILWWILCCGDNWDILKTETTRYLWGLQQVKKLVYLPLVCYFSVKGVIGISSPPHLAGIFLFSRLSLLHQFLSICSTLLYQNGQVLTHGTQNLLLHRGTTGLFDLCWKNTSYVQKITLTSFNFLVHEKKENRGKIKATSIFVLRHA